MITSLYNCLIYIWSLSPCSFNKIEGFFYYLREENAHVLLWVITDHEKPTKKSLVLFLLIITYGTNSKLFCVYFENLVIFTKKYHPILVKWTIQSKIMPFIHLSDSKNQGQLKFTLI